MAILGKVSGSMLQSNLLRYNVDLVIDANLMYFDTNNRRIGINNNLPGNSLTVGGTTTLGNVFISQNTVAATTGNLSLYSYSGNIDASNQRIGNIATPIYSTDATSKSYVDTAIASYTSTANVAFSDGTRNSNILVDGNPLVFAGNTNQINAYLLGTTLNLSFINSPTVYGNLTAGNLISNSSLQVNSNAYVSGNLTVNGNIYSIVSNLYSVGGIFYGNAAGFGAIYAGVSSGYVLQPDTIVQLSANVNNFAQLNLQNINSGNNSSGDLVVTADNGSNNDTFIDMGINGSTYNQSAFNLQKANDGYLYVSGNTTTGGGNLVISTTTANDIIFSLNGTTTSNEVARLRANTNSFVISSNTAATNTTTGALIVNGGAGIAANLYANNINVGNIVSTSSLVVGNISGVNNINTANLTATGNITAGNVTATFYGNLVGSFENLSGNISVGNVNVTSNVNAGNLNATGNVTASYYFGNGSTLSGMYGNVQTNAFMGTYTGNLIPYNVNGNVITSNISATSYNPNIGLTPGYHGIVTVNSNTAVLMPVGNTFNYPTTSIAGMMRWNTDLGYMEVYNGTAWTGVETGTGMGMIASDVFTGNGTQTQFTLSQNNTTQGTIVSINGVVQIPTTSYTVSGNVLTLNEAPISTDVVEARSVTQVSMVSAIRNGNTEILATAVGIVPTVDFILNGNITHSFDIANSNITGNLYVGNLITTSGVYWSNGSPYSSGSGGGSGNIAFYAQNTAPVGAALGSTWYQGNTDILYEYVKDAANNTFWLDIVTSPSVFGNLTVSNTLTISATVINAANTNISSTTNMLDSFSPTSYRTAKYIVSGSSGTNYQSTEAVVIQNGSTANIAIFGNTWIGTPFYSLTANIYSGSATLWATTSSNAYFKIANTYIPL